MASGKSLELKKFDEEHALKNRQQVVCRCGEVWKSDKHFTKKGDIRTETVKNVECYPTGAQGLMVKMVAVQQAGKLKVKK